MGSTIVWLIHSSRNHCRIVFKYIFLTRQQEQATTRSTTMIDSTQYWIGSNQWDGPFVPELLEGYVPTVWMADPYEDKEEVDLQQIE